MNIPKNRFSSDSDHWFLYVASENISLIFVYKIGQQEIIA
jgi:hypothetical protein